MNGVYLLGLSFLLAFVGLADIFYRNFKKQKVPFYWILIIWFVPLIGLMLYFILKPWEKSRVTVIN